MSSKRRRNSYSPYENKKFKLDLIFKEIAVRTSSIHVNNEVDIISEEPSSSKLKLTECPAFEHMDLDINNKSLEEKFFGDIQVDDELLVRVFKAGYVELIVQLVSTLSRYRRCFCRFVHYMENENIKRLLKNPYLDTVLKIDLESQTSANESIYGSLKSCKTESARELRNMQKNKRLLDLVSAASEHTRSGEYELAISLFTKALNIDENCADAYCGRGAANAGNKNFVGALIDLNKAMELQPKHVNAKNYRIAVMIAHAKNLEKDTKTKTEAKKLFREAWELSGKRNQEALNGMKRLDNELIHYVNLSGDEDDVQVLNRSASSHPNSTPARLGKKKRSSTQMDAQDIQKLNDIEKFINAMKKK